MATTSQAIQLLLQARDESAGAFESVSRRLDGLRSHVESIKTLIASGLGFEAINAGIGGIENFASGLISANQQAQNLHQTLEAVYGSVQEANAAFAWIRNNEMRAPFDLQSIQQASVLVATYGGDITKVMPMLETLAAVHKQTLGTAAQAWQDLVTANLGRMMARDFGITKDMLVSTGLAAMDAKRHLTGDVQGALEALVAGRYPNALAQQMQTLTGVMSSLHTQITLFQQTAGGAVFGQLQQHITALVQYMQSHQGQVQAFAQVVGNALGGMSASVFGGIQWLIANLPKAVNILGNVWHAVSGPASAAFHLIGGAISAFINWFQGSALPVIYTAIGMMAIWWQEHGVAVRAALVNIGTTVQSFTSTFVASLRDTWNMVASDAKFLWDTLGVLFTLGGDAITGDWSKFGTDFVNGIKKMAGDSIQAFAALMVGLVDLTTRIGFSIAQALVPIAQDLAKPLSWIAQQFRNLFKEIGGLIGAFAGSVVTALTNLEGQFARFFNHLIDGYNALADKLHVSKLADLTDPTAIPKPVGPVYGPRQPFIGPIMPGYHPPSQPMGPPMPPLSPGDQASKAITDWFNQHAPGLDKGQTFKPMTQGQLEAARTSLITPVDNAIRDMANRLQAMLDPSSTHVKKARQDAQKLGKEIVDNLFGQITKGSFTLPSAVTNPFGPVPTSLPTPYGIPREVLPDAAAAGGRGVGSGLGSLPTGRVPLGALGATFMQTIATGGPLGTGADPATRAAQRTADAQSTHTRLLTDMLHATGEVAASTGEMVQRLEALTAALLKHGIPTSNNPLQHHGVARPAV